MKQTYFYILSETRMLRNDYFMVFVYKCQYCVEKIPILIKKWSPKCNSFLQCSITITLSGKMKHVNHSPFLSKHFWPTQQSVQILIALQDFFVSIQKEKSLVISSRVHLVNEKNSFYQSCFFPGTVVACLFWLFWALFAVFLPFPFLFLSYSWLLTNAPAQLNQKVAKTPCLLRWGFQPTQGTLTWHTGCARFFQCLLSFLKKQ